MSEPILGRAGDVVSRYGAKPSPVLAGETLGVSRDVGNVLLPVNGLRHPPAGRTCGWYVWAGEELSDDADFFLPRHLEHLGPIAQYLRPYLELPPGW